MLTLQIHDQILEKQLTELLNQKFNGNLEKMLQEFIQLYTSQLNRLKYSGILKWEKDGLTFQKEIRSSLPHSSLVAASTPGKVTTFGSPSET